MSVPAILALDGSKTSMLCATPASSFSNVSVIVAPAGSVAAVGTNIVSTPLIVMAVPPEAGGGVGTGVGAGATVGAGGATVGALAGFVAAG